MAEAIVSGLLEQLTSIIAEEIGKEVSLVVGVDKEVEKLRSNLQAIEAVVADAEQRQLKEKTTVRLWLDRLKHISYNIEDVLDEWNYALLKQRIEGADENPPVPNKKKVCFSLPCSCFSFKQVGFRHDIALKIKEINEKLDVIAQEKDRYNFNVIRGVEMSERVQSTSFVDVSEIYGRAEDKRTLVRKLCESSEQRLPIIAIVGMGGIGKTTLAQFAYKDNEVINNFDKIMWVCVSDPFDEYKIVKAIIEVLEDTTCDLGELESLLLRISRSIVGNKFLLVLDDVWTEDYKKWEPLYHCLKNGRYGSKILVTTRKESVVRMMGSVDIITVEKLPDNECWSLFRQFAFFGRSHEEREKLEEIGRGILTKCKGLPLAVKTIGSLLRFKRTRQEWQSVLDSELWKLEKFEKEVFSPLLLSYSDLPFMIKRCFVYCAIFPKDYNINKVYLINLWMAHGYLKGDENKAMEIAGQEYFDYLASRSFFQEFLKDDDDIVISCKMHDLVHDFAQFLSKNECLSIEDGVKQPFINSSCHDQVHHLMIKLSRRDSFLDSICSLKRLRSFLYSGQSSSYLPSDILLKLFGELSSLRALDIRTNYALSMIKDIPKEIGKLIHLRYLNLSRQKIRTLPEALCGLYNLQTLDITQCGELGELPQGIEKLINLRHLLNYGTSSLNYMPIGIQRLTCLRTLRQFPVSSGGDDNKACSLEGLKNLNLFGNLSITRLGNVSDVDEAKRSELKHQKNLLHLDLDFRKHDDKEETRNEDNEVLLEILRPPLNLDSLWLCYYRGNAIWPNWMMSFTNLTKLFLYKCENCKHLPPLGKLSSLESLDIYELKSVKRVSSEFLGIESDDGTSSSFIAFPKLKYLRIWDLNELEEWDYEIKQNGEDHITIMPSLVSLEIHNCPKLKAIPNYLVQNTMLKKRIWGCRMLENC